MEMESLWYDADREKYFSEKPVPLPLSTTNCTFGANPGLQGEKPVNE
jgi:hypothetical protein